MKFLINSRNFAASNPKNLEHLPNWVDVEVVERDGVFYLSEVVVNRRPTFDLLDEIWELQQNSPISLKNSNRITAGEDVRMCEHLYLIYRTLYKGMEKILGEASYQLSKRA